jgi:hypothetical protein
LDGKIDRAVWQAIAHGKVLNPHFTALAFVACFLAALGRPDLFDPRLMYLLLPFSISWPVSVSAISQNQPGIIEIKGLKTSHFKEIKIAPLDRGEIGSMGTSNVLK